MKQANIIDTCACGGAGHLVENDIGFYVKCEHAPHWYTPPVYRTPQKAIRCWNDMQQNMDNLARNAMVAVHRGLSYGNYIPIKGQIPELPTPETVTAPKENRKICVICGAEIPKGTCRTKYCSASCADVALVRQNEQRKRRLKQNKK